MLGVFGYCFNVKKASSCRNASLGGALSLGEVLVAGSPLFICGLFLEHWICMYVKLHLITARFLLS